MKLGLILWIFKSPGLAFKGVLNGQLYLVDFNDNKAELDTCLIDKANMGWLWHRRLAHVGMKNLHKLLKGEHILGLTNVHFEKDRICSACQTGKQVEVHHPHKNIMTTDRPLELCWCFCLPGQIDPTREWKECLQSLARNAKSFVDLPCEDTVRGYL
jgi:hypothetical protein